MTTNHEPDAEKAFREFFNAWVAAETKAQAATSSLKGNALRWAVRDAALVKIKLLIEGAFQDRFAMQALERDDL